MNSGMSIHFDIITFNQKYESWDVTQKRKEIRYLCNTYNPFVQSLEDTLKFLRIVLEFFMIYRLSFRKKDNRFLGFMNKINHYLLEIKNDPILHEKSLIYLSIKLMIGIAFSDMKKIYGCHCEILEFMEKNFCKGYITQKAKEHDSLEILVMQLEQIFNLILILKKFGFYYFDYYSFQTSHHISLEKILLHLIPYLVGKKIHYEYLHSVVPEDLNEPNFGLPWNPKRGILLVSFLKPHFKKIEKRIKGFQ